MVQVATDQTFSHAADQPGRQHDDAPCARGIVQQHNLLLAVNPLGTGRDSSWSAVWIFATVKPPVKVVPLPPQAPTLVAPADGAAMQPLTPALIWNSSSGATAYTVQVATDRSFAATILSQSNSATSLPVLAVLSNETTYFWRVEASAEAGNSDWSAVWGFSTRPAAVEKFTGAIRGINFRSSSAVILRSSYPTLDSAVAIFKRYPTLQIQIDGHADSTWTPEFNQKLSESRAASVKTYLVAKGIAENRIATAGHGSTMPVASNATPEGRAANRRIEFSLTNQ